MNAHEQRQAIILLSAMEDALALAKANLSNARYNLEEFPHKRTMRTRHSDAHDRAVDAWNIARQHIKRHAHLAELIDDTLPTLYLYKTEITK